MLLVMEIANDIGILETNGMVQEIKRNYGHIIGDMILFKKRFVKPQ